MIHVPNIYDQSKINVVVDNDKTKKRIFYELPKCNWLEEKIKDIEKTKKSEEQRR